MWFNFGQLLENWANLYSNIWPHSNGLVYCANDVRELTIKQRQLSCHLYGNFSPYKVSKISLDRLKTIGGSTVVGVENVYTKRNIQQQDQQLK